MKYIVRSLKYFVYLIVILTLIIVVLVLAGFAEEGGTLLDAETDAIFLDCCQFLVVQVDDLSMRATERCSALLKIIRIRCRSVLFFSCQNLNV